MLRFPWKLRNCLRLGCRWKCSGNFDGEVRPWKPWGGELSIPAPSKSVGATLYEHLKEPERQDKIFQICSDTKKQITTGIYLKSAVAMAEGLRERGIEKGDFIILVGSNSPQMNMALTGIFFMGAVAVPISGRSQIEEFKFLIEYIKPKFFVCDQENLFMFGRVLEQSQQLEKSKMLILDERRHYWEKDIETFEDFIRGKGEDVENFKPAEVENPKEELALVMKALSSGFVGRAVGITHDNLNHVIARYEPKKSKYPSYVILMVHKITWTSGINSLVVSSCFGATIVVVKTFDEEKFMQAIEDYKVTVASLYVSRVWQLYKYKFSKVYDVSSCKHVYALDGAFPETLIKGIKEKTGLTLMPSFSLNELTGFATRSSRAAKLKNGCVGKLIPLMCVKVISDKTNERAKPLEAGELWFKGPTVSKGYINDPKSTRELFDEDGFFRSGIFGYYDDEEYIFVIDKMAAVFNCKGTTVSPRNLEATIKSLESVKDVAVSGIQNPTDGFYPIAFVVPQKGHKLTADEVIKYVNGMVEDHWRLRGGVIFVSKIPRSKDDTEIRRNIFKNILSKYQMKSEVKLTEEPRSEAQHEEKKKPAPQTTPESAK